MIAPLQHVRPKPRVSVDPLLIVRDLSKQFPVRLGFRSTGYVSAVDRVSFEIKGGSTLGIVGESGCGKSTAARLILGLAEPDSGRLIFDGYDLRLEKGKAQRREIYKNMQMVFQDPYSSLNPRMSVGESIAFAMKIHRFPKAEIRDRTAMLLSQVGLNPNHASYYPHQMSGGQRQRVNIARALALNPKLVIADEAVSALDKSVQAQVLNLLQDLQEEYGLTYMFISHDLNVVEYMSDDVAVMYLGQLVETCSSEQLFQNPMHPYTRALLAAIPTLESGKASTELRLEGEIPSPMNPPSGCRFRTRCPEVMPVCSETRPPLRDTGDGHRVACHLYEDDTPHPTRSPATPALAGTS